MHINIAQQKKKKKKSFQNPHHKPPNHFTLNHEHKKFEKPNSFEWHKPPSISPTHQTQKPIHFNPEHPNPNGTWAKFRHKPIPIHQTHTQFNYLFRWWPDLKHHTEIARSGFIHRWHHTDDRQKWGATCGFIHCHQTLHRLYVPLLDKNRPRLIAKCFHLRLLQRFALHQMLGLMVQINVRRHHFVSFSVTHSLSFSLRSDLHRQDRRFLINVFWCILLPCSPPLPSLL